VRYYSISALCNRPCEQGRPPLERRSFIMTKSGADAIEQVEDEQEVAPTRKIYTFQLVVAIFSLAVS
jgi:hypothetical protein